MTLYRGNVISAAVGSNVYQLSNRRLFFSQALIYQRCSRLQRVRLPRERIY